MADTGDATRKTAADAGGDDTEGAVLEAEVADKVARAEFARRRAERRKLLDRRNDVRKLLSFPQTAKVSAYGASAERLSRSALLALASSAGDGTFDMAAAATSAADHGGSTSGGPHMAERGNNRLRQTAALLDRTGAVAQLRSQLSTLVPVAMERARATQQGISAFEAHVVDDWCAKLDGRLMRLSAAFAEFNNARVGRSAAAAGAPPGSPLHRWVLLSLFPLIESVQAIDDKLGLNTRLQGRVLDMLLKIVADLPPLALASEDKGDLDSIENMLAGQLASGLSGAGGAGVDMEREVQAVTALLSVAVQRGQLSSIAKAVGVTLRWVERRQDSGADVPKLAVSRVLEQLRSYQRSQRFTLFSTASLVDHFALERLPQRATDTGSDPRDESGGDGPDELPTEPFWWVTPPPDVYGDLVVLSRRLLVHAGNGLLAIGLGHGGVSAGQVCQRNIHFQADEHVSLFTLDGTMYCHSPAPRCSSELLPDRSVLAFEVDPVRMEKTGTTLRFAHSDDTTTVASWGKYVRVVPSATGSQILGIRLEFPTVSMGEEPDDAQGSSEASESGVSELEAREGRSSHDDVDAAEDVGAPEARTRQTPTVWVDRIVRDREIDADGSVGIAVFDSFQLQFDWAELVAVAKAELRYLERRVLKSAAETAEARKQTEVVAETLTISADAGAPEAPDSAGSAEVLGTDAGPSTSTSAGGSAGLTANIGSDGEEVVSAPASSPIEEGETVSSVRKDAREAARRVIRNSTALSPAAPYACGVVSRLGFVWVGDHLYFLVPSDVFAHPESGTAESEPVPRKPARLLTFAVGSGELLGDRLMLTAANVREIRRARKRAATSTGSSSRTAASPYVWEFEVAPGMFHPYERSAAAKLEKYRERGALETQVHTNGMVYAVKLTEPMVQTNVETGAVRNVRRSLQSRYTTNASLQREKSEKASAKDVAVGAEVECSSIDVIHNGPGSAKATVLRIDADQTAVVQLEDGEVAVGVPLSHLSVVSKRPGSGPSASGAATHEQRDDIILDRNSLSDNFRSVAYDPVSGLLCSYRRAALDVAMWNVASYWPQLSRAGLAPYAVHPATSVTDECVEAGTACAATLQFVAEAGHAAISGAEPQPGLGCRGTFASEPSDEAFSSLLDIVGTCIAVLSRAETSAEHVNASVSSMLSALLLLRHNLSLASSRLCPGVADTIRVSIARCMLVDIPRCSAALERRGCTVASNELSRACCTALESCIPLVVGAEAKRARDLLVFALQSVGSSETDDAVPVSSAGVRDLGTFADVVRSHELGPSLMDCIANLMDNVEWPSPSLAVEVLGIEGGPIVLLQRFLDASVEVTRSRLASAAPRGEVDSTSAPLRILCFLQSVLGSQIAAQPLPPPVSASPAHDALEGRADDRKMASPSDASPQWTTILGKHALMVFSASDALCAEVAAAVEGGAVASEALCVLEESPVGTLLPTLIVLLCGGTGGEVRAGLSLIGKELSRLLRTLSMCADVLGVRDSTTQIGTEDSVAHPSRSWMLVLCRSLATLAAKCIRQAAVGAAADSAEESNSELLDAPMLCGGIDAGADELRDRSGETAARSQFLASLHAGSPGALAWQRWLRSRVRPNALNFIRGRGAKPAVEAAEGIALAVLIKHTDCCSPAFRTFSAFPKGGKEPEGMDPTTVASCVDTLRPVWLAAWRVAGAIYNKGKLLDSWEANLLKFMDGGRRRDEAEAYVTTRDAAQVRDLCNSLGVEFYDEDLRRSVTSLLDLMRSEVDRRLTVRNVGSDSKDDGASESKDAAPSESKGVDSGAVDPWSGKINELRIKGQLLLDFAPSISSIRSDRGGGGETGGGPVAAAMHVQTPARVPRMQRSTSAIGPAPTASPMRRTRSTQREKRTPPSRRHAQQLRRSGSSDGADDVAEAALSASHSRALNRVVSTGSVLTRSAPESSESAPESSSDGTYFGLLCSDIHSFLLGHRDITAATVGIIRSCVHHRSSRALLRLDALSTLCELAALFGPNSQCLILLSGLGRALHDGWRGSATLPSHGTAVAPHYLDGVRSCGHELVHRLREAFFQLLRALVKLMECVPAEKAEHGVASAVRVAAIEAAGIAYQPQDARMLLSVDLVGVLRRIIVSAKDRDAAVARSARNLLLSVATVVSSWPSSQPMEYADGFIGEASIADSSPNGPVGRLQRDVFSTVFQIAQFAASVAVSRELRTVSSATAGHRVVAGSVVAGAGPERDTGGSSEAKGDEPLSSGDDLPTDGLEQPLLVDSADLNEFLAVVLLHRGRTIAELCLSDPSNAVTLLRLLSRSQDLVLPLCLLRTSSRLLGEILSRCSASDVQRAIASQAPCSMFGVTFDSASLAEEPQDGAMIVKALVRAVGVSHLHVEHDTDGDIEQDADSDPTLRFLPKASTAQLEDGDLDSESTTWSVVVHKPSHVSAKKFAEESKGAVRHALGTQDQQGVPATWPLRGWSDPKGMDMERAYKKGLESANAGPIARHSTHRAARLIAGRMAQYGFTCSIVSDETLQLMAGEATSTSVKTASKPGAAGKGFNAHANSRAAASVCGARNTELAAQLPALWSGGSVATCLAADLVDLVRQLGGYDHHCDTAAGGPAGGPTSVEAEAATPSASWAAPTARVLLAGVQALDGLSLRSLQHQQAADCFGALQVMGADIPPMRIGARVAVVDSGSHLLNATVLDFIEGSPNVSVLFDGQLNPSNVEVDTVRCVPVVRAPAPSDLCVTRRSARHQDSGPSVSLLAVLQAMEAFLKSAMGTRVVSASGKVARLRTSVVRALHSMFDKDEEILALAVQRTSLVTLLRSIAAVDDNGATDKLRNLASLLSRSNMYTVEQLFLRCTQVELDFAAARIARDVPGKVRFVAPMAIDDSDGGGRQGATVAMPKLPSRISVKRARDASFTSLTGRSLLTAPGEEARAFLLSDHPVPDALPHYYFEVTLEGAKAPISPEIGFYSRDGDESSRPPATERSTSRTRTSSRQKYRALQFERASWSTGSVYRRVAQSTVVQRSQSGNRTVEYPPVEFVHALAEANTSGSEREGTVLGCGWDLCTGRCYFTQNGEFLGDVDFPLPAGVGDGQGVDARFPALSLTGDRVYVRFNFGQAKFAFTPLEYQSPPSVPGANRLRAWLQRSSARAPDAAPAVPRVMESCRCYRRRNLATVLAGGFLSGWPAEHLMALLERNGDDVQRAANWVFGNDGASASMLEAAASGVGAYPCGNHSHVNLLPPISAFDGLWCEHAGCNFGPPVPDFPGVRAKPAVVSFDDSGAISNATELAGCAAVVDMIPQASVLELAVRCQAAGAVAVVFKSSMETPSPLLGDERGEPSGDSAADAAGTTVGAASAPSTPSDSQERGSQSTEASVAIPCVVLSQASSTQLRDKFSEFGDRLSAALMVIAKGVREDPEAKRQAAAARAADERAAELAAARAAEAASDAIHGESWGGPFDPDLSKQLHLHMGDFCANSGASAAGLEPEIDPEELEEWFRNVEHALRARGIEGRDELMQALRDGDPGGMAMYAISEAIQVPPKPKPDAEKAERDAEMRDGHRLLFPSDIKLSTIVRVLPKADQVIEQLLSKPQKSRYMVGQKVLIRGVAGKIVMVNPDGTAEVEYTRRGGEVETAIIPPRSGRSYTDGRRQWHPALGSVLGVPGVVVKLDEEHQGCPAALLRFYNPNTLSVQDFWFPLPALAAASATATLMAQATFGVSTAHEAHARAVYAAGVVERMIAKKAVLLCELRGPLRVSSVGGAVSDSGVTDAAREVPAGITAPLTATRLVTDPELLRLVIRECFGGPVRESASVALQGMRGALGAVENATASSVTAGRPDSGDSDYMLLTLADALPLLLQNSSKDVAASKHGLLWATLKQIAEFTSKHSSVVSNSDGSGLGWGSVMCVRSTPKSAYAASGGDESPADGGADESKAGESAAPSDAGGKAAGGDLSGTDDGCLPTSGASTILCFDAEASKVHSAVELIFWEDANCTIPLRVCTAPPPLHIPDSGTEASRQGLTKLSAEAMVPSWRPLWTNGTEVHVTVRRSDGRPHGTFPEGTPPADAETEALDETSFRVHLASVPPEFWFVCWSVRHILSEIEDASAPDLESVKAFWVEHLRDVSSGLLLLSLAPSTPQLVRQICYALLTRCLFALGEVPNGKAVSQLCAEMLSLHSHEVDFGGTLFSPYFQELVQMVAAARIVSSVDDWRSIWRHATPEQSPAPRTESGAFAALEEESDGGADEVNVPAWFNDYACTFRCLLQLSSGRMQDAEFARSAFRDGGLDSVRSLLRGLPSPAKETSSEALGTPRSVSSPQQRKKMGSKRRRKTGKRKGKKRKSRASRSSRRSPQTGDTAGDAGSPPSSAVESVRADATATAEVVDGSSAAATTSPGERVADGGSQSRPGASASESPRPSDPEVSESASPGDGATAATSDGAATTTSVEGAQRAPAALAAASSGDGDDDDELMAALLLSMAAGAAGETEGGGEPSAAQATVHHGDESKQDTAEQGSHGGDDLAAGGAGGPPAGATDADQLEPDVGSVASDGNSSDDEQAELDAAIEGHLQQWSAEEDRQFVQWLALLEESELLSGDMLSVALKALPVDDAADQRALEEYVAGKSAGSDADSSPDEPSEVDAESEAVEQPKTVAADADDSEVREEVSGGGAAGEASTTSEQGSGDNSSQVVPAAAEGDGSQERAGAPADATSPAVPAASDSEAVAAAGDIAATGGAVAAAERETTEQSAADAVDTVAAAVSSVALAAGGAEDGGSLRWNCPTCTFANSMARGVCDMCGTGAPPDSGAAAPPPPPSDGPLFAPFGGAMAAEEEDDSWQCMRCSFRNASRDWEACQVCGGLNDALRGDGEEMDGMYDELERADFPGVRLVAGGADMMGDPDDEDADAEGSAPLVEDEVDVIVADEDGSQTGEVEPLLGDDLHDGDEVTAVQSSRAHSEGDSAHAPAASPEARQMTPIEKASRLLQQFELLRKMSSAQLRQRLLVLQKLNACVSRTLPLVNMLPLPSMDEDEGGESASNATERSPTDLPALLAHHRELLFFETKVAFWDRMLTLTGTTLKSQRPRVVVDRFLAAGKASPSESDETSRPTGGASILEQAWRTMYRVDPHRMRQPTAEPHLAFDVSFKGERVEGEAGPYRAFFSDISRELWAGPGAGQASPDSSSAADDAGPRGTALAPPQEQGSMLPLLTRVPNHIAGHGENRDAFMLRAGAVGEHELELLEFTGRVMGCALRTHTLMPLQLPSIMWKPLVGEKVGRPDLLAIQEDLVRSVLEGIERSTEETFAEDYGKLVWAALLADGTSVSLVHPEDAEDGGGAASADDASDGGSDTESSVPLPTSPDDPVTFEQRHLYVQRLEEAYLHQCDRQLAAVRKGISQVVPTRLLSLFTWREMERMLCGNKTVSVDLLRRHTVYRGIEETAPCVGYFWTVLTEFAQEERRRFVKFAWGQERLPATDADFERFPRTRMSIMPPKVKAPPRRPQRPTIFGRDRRLAEAAESNSSANDVSKMSDADRQQYYDSMFPSADTCFFNFYLPPYSSLEVTRKKLSDLLTMDSWGMDGDDVDPNT